MRSREEILNDIKQFQESIQECQKELLDFEANCPHPDHYLVKLSSQDFDDGCMGVPNYMSTVTKVQCKLCGCVKSMKFDKTNFRPTLRHVIDQ